MDKTVVLEMAKKAVAQINWHKVTSNALTSAGLMLIQLGVKVTWNRDLSVVDAVFSKNKK